MALIAKLPQSIQKMGIIPVAFVSLAVALVIVLNHYSQVKPYQHALPTTNVKNIATPQAVPEQARPGIPQRLKIPTINLDTTVERVSLTPGGDLDTPKTITSTGWYQDGARPGQAGSAVIDGHYGWIRSKPAIFNDLNKLKKGDEIHIEDDAGVNITFIVRGSRLYAPGEDAAAVFHSDDGRAYLNLITCQGTWENSQHSYSTRLVVFAEKAPSPSL